VLADIRRDHSSVAHVTPEVFTALVGRPQPPVVFDVREPQEFAVSHLPGAVRVDPSLSADAFLAAYGDLIKGRDVVLYCSVGKRSSLLAERVAGVSRAKGALSVANLDGGLFRWHNEGRALVRATTPTSAIHPYDAFWGRHVKRQSEVRMTPLPSAP
jgi:rhodanese-related sulfurtransferase